MMIVNTTKTKVRITIEAPEFGSPVEAHYYDDWDCIYNNPKNFVVLKDTTIIDTVEHLPNDRITVLMLK